METRTVDQNVVVGSGPIAGTRHDSVISAVKQRRGMSGAAFIALVVAAMTAAAVITMLIVNSQRTSRDEERAREQARIATAQQAPAQSAPEPLLVRSQPAVVTAAAPSRQRAFESEIATTSAGLEIEITSRLQNDERLRRFAVFVKVTHGTAALSGQVPSEDLKKRAEKLAGTVSGVRSVINEIAVTP